MFKGSRLIEIAKPPGRNEPCPCGSGKKYKKCCMSGESSGNATLSAEDTKLFFRIFNGLMASVSKDEKKIMVLDSENDMRGYQNFIADMRDICWQDPVKYIHNYIVKDNDMDDRTRSILEEWEQKHIIGTFFIMDFKPEYAVIMHADFEEKSGKLYGVKGLTDSVAHVAKRKKPVAVQMMLLPFEGKIVYDGMMNYLKFDFTEDEVKLLTDVYDAILKEESIITEL